MAQRGKRIRPDILQEAEALAAQGWQPAEIEAQLHASFGPSAPQRRTIQAIVSRVRAVPSQVWRLASAEDPDEAALVLPVLRAAIEWTEGRVTALREDEARWIVRLRKAASDMPEAEAYRLALALRTSAPEWLEPYLAFAPWRDASEAYNRAFIDRRISTYHYNVFSKSDPMEATR